MRLPHSPRLYNRCKNARFQVPIFVADKSSTESVDVQDVSESKVAMPSSAIDFIRFAWIYFPGMARRHEHAMVAE